MKRGSTFYAWLMDNDMSEPELEALAERVAAAYTVQRRKVFPAYRPRPDARHASVEYWFDLAMRLHDEKIEAEEFMEIQFVVWKSDPQPGMVKSDRAFHEYWKIKRDASAGPDALEEIRSFSTKFEYVRNAHPEWSATQILLDESTGFGPVFIWCVAAMDPALHPIRDAYRPIAEKILGRKPLAYAEAYRKLFPGPFGEIDA